jgi:hypothetical protein
MQEITTSREVAKGGITRLAQKAIAFNREYNLLSHMHMRTFCFAF